MRGGFHRTVCGLALVAGLASGCAASRPHGGSLAVASVTARTETGTASYYGREHDGRRTASGERFDMKAMTAAHRTLPFGTRVRVTNLANGRAVIVRINDRGPFRKGRILDVSRGAAQRLGMIGPGTARVRVEVVSELAGDD